MAKKVFFLVLIVLVTTGFSQSTITLKGKLIDSIGKQSLQNASVVLLDAKDSTLERYTLAKLDGGFEIKSIDAGNYILQITFQGFDKFSKSLSLQKDKPELNLGNIYLSQQTKDLGNVTVTQSPIAIKKDTVEYNAGSFKTKPNAVVEDLLKKMPGIQVDKDGTVKAQGEQVQRVLVDGKRFFGDDPKMATKNLPPDVVDKIQVFDGLSDQSNFTGFDDGNRVKTLNIITKKDKRKGYFGKGSTGMGTDGNQTLHDHNINLSRFNGNQQLTFTGQGNNVNKQNFSVQDILGSLGGSSGNMRGFGGNMMQAGSNRGGFAGINSMINSLIGSGSSNGLVNTWSGGLNYRDVWSKKTEAYGSGFYNHQKTNRIQNSYTENFVSNNPDSSIFNNQKNNVVTTNQNSRFNFNIEHQFDSANSLIARPNISFQNTSNQTQQITSSIKSKNISLNNTSVNNSKTNNGFNSNAEIIFRHRFKRKGRTVSLSTNMVANENNGEGNNYSIIQSYANSVTKNDTINQQYTTNSRTRNFNSTLSYTEPIGKNQQLELAYNYINNNSSNTKNTFSYNNDLKTFSIPVSNLTNDFRNEYLANRATISYRYSNPKMNFSIGNGMQWGRLISNNLSQKTNIEQTFTNLFPTANFNYSFSKTQNLRFNYNGRTNQPSAQQLQPVVDNTDPLNIKLGNPVLQQSFNHSFRVFYNSFDILTQKLFFATLITSFTQNDIQNSTTISPTGVQITQPVNLNGTYNIAGFINYGFPLRKPKSNLNFGVNFAAIQSQSLINNQNNYTKNTTLGGMVTWTTNLKEKWDFNIISNSTFNIAKYTLQPTQDANYFSQFCSVEGTYYTKTGWILSTDFDYTYNSGRATGFNTSIPLLNASVAKQIFKNKAGEIKLYFFDLLNQNQSVTRNVTANYVQDVQTQVLGRYAMLSFTYNLRNFAGKNNKMPGFFPNQRGQGRNRGN